MAKRGIDISAHQGNIDLAALKNQIDFVIIRAGYGTNGTIDTKFKRNADLCRQLGIPVGFYWYSYALDVEGARREALAFINAIEPYKDITRYGAWFDMEDADHYKERHGMPSNETLRKMCGMFCKMVEESGFYAGIYASLSWFNNKLTGEETKHYDRWVAQWPTSGGKQTALNTKAESRSQYHLWQFTSAGRFSGYNGNLDTNYAYTDFPNPGQTSKPVEQSKPQSSKTIEGSTLDIVYRVMKKEFGDGEQRKHALGNRYDEVQDFINHIYNTDVNTLAKEVKAGKYGNNPVRSTVLGDRYQEVQNIVNGLSGSSSKVYVVKSGDTLSGIGAKLGVNWQTLAKNNGISGPKYTIYPGQKIKY